MKILESVLLLALLVLVMLIPAVQADDRPRQRILSFGVVPQQAASRLAKEWGPVLKHLEQETGVRLRFHTAPDIPTFEQRLREGVYDLAYMNPYHYTVFHVVPGYRAFSRAKDKRIRGILVVPLASPIKTLAQLEGSRLAFPAPAAFAATLLPRANLRGQGVSIEPVYVSSHDSVYRAVAKGLYPAGGGIMRTFNGAPREVRDQLRVLWTTPGYTPHALAAHPRVGDELVSAIQKALSAMDGEPAAAELLKPLKIKGFEAAEDADWNDVRSLNLQATVGEG